MYNKQIFFFSVAFLFITSAGLAQEANYFDRLNQYQNGLSRVELIDSIMELPYSTMVDDLYQSELWFKNGMTYARYLHDENRLANISARIATVFYLQGKYDSSTYYNIEAIRMYDKLNLEIEKGEVLCELGYQTKRRDLTLAFEYFREGIFLLEKNNADESSKSHAYDNYGVLFEMNNELDSAGYFYNEALVRKEAANDSIAIPYSLNKIAQLNLIAQRFDVAKTYFDRAYEIRKRLNDAFGLAENETFYGDLYTASEEWDKAIEWYEKSNVSAELLKYPRLLQYNYEQLVTCYEKVKRYQDALVVSQKSAKLKDELLNEKNSRTILELEKRFESAEKDRNISRLESETTKRKFTIYGVAALAVILLLIAFAYIVNARRKARAAKDAAIIEEREAGLLAVFDATEDERKRIAKDLHDMIGQQLSGLRLSWEGLENKIASQVPEQASRLNQLTKILDEACTEVRSISHTMMPKVLQERGLLAAIEEMLRKNLGLTSIRFQIEHLNVEDVRFHERIELSIYRVCQELVNNIIKHSKASDVTIQLMRRKGHLILIVEDNGIGFSRERGKDGIGMMNIASRLNTVKGEADIEQGPECGVVATIRVPVE